MNNYTTLAFHLVKMSNLPMTKNAISGRAMEEAAKFLFKAAPKVKSAPLALMDRAAHSEAGVKDFAEKAMKSRSGESAVKEKLFAAGRTGDKKHFEMPGVSTKDFLKQKANYERNGKSWVAANAKEKTGITDAPRIGKVKLDPAGSMSDTELMPGGIYRDNPGAGDFPNNDGDGDYFSKFTNLLKGNKNSIIAGGFGGLAGSAAGRFSNSVTNNDNNAHTISYYK